MSKTTKTPLVKCHNLCKIYQDKIAVNDINLEIPRGKIIGLLGQNGAGKTTLIKLLNDLIVPTSGEILINGQPIGAESKKIISYLPEHSYLDRSSTLQAMLNYFQDFYTDFDYDRALQLIHDLNLDTTARISSLSKGMQEKFQLILVMSRQADLYILDEPLGGIDPATRDYILDTILSNFNEAASMIIATHLIADIERILDQVIFMDRGKIILHQDADELRASKKQSIDEIFRQQFKANINE